MKKLILLCLLLAFALPVYAQNFGSVTTIRTVLVLPATCDATRGEVVFLIGVGQYECDATNTWNRSGGGAVTPGGTDQSFQFNNTGQLGGSNWFLTNPTYPSLMSTAPFQVQTTDPKCGSSSFGCTLGAFTGTAFNAEIFNTQSNLGITPLYLQSHSNTGTNVAIDSLYIDSPLVTGGSYQRSYGIHIFDQNPANAFGSTAAGLWIENQTAPGFALHTGTGSVSFGGTTTAPTFNAISSYQVGGVALASTNLSDSSGLVRTTSAATFGAFFYDFGASSHFRPVAGLTASKPATCSAGEVYMATDATAGQNWYFCTATNVWTQQLNSGGGGGSGTISANSTANAHAVAVYASNAGSTTVQADTGAFSDGAGAFSAKSVTGTDTTHTGQLSVAGQTLDNGVPTNAFGFIGWAATGITSFLFRPSTTAPAANTVWLAGAPTTNIAPLSWGKVTSAYTDTSIAATGVDINTANQVTATHLAAPLPIVQGGNGTASPGIVAGANCTVTGSWPTQTVNCTGSGGSNTLTVANSAATGTTLNTLTKITGAPSTALIAATTDTGGMVGITTSGAGTTGSATITFAGSVSCVFDGATTAGDYVQISSTTAGNCHDAGASYPTSNQVIGRILSTNAAGGTYTLDLYPSEIKAASGGSGVGAMFANSTFGGSPIAGSATNYFGVVGAATWTTGEGNRSIIIPASCTAKNLYARLSGTQAADGALTICLRQNLTTTTTLCVTLAASGTGAVLSDTTHTVALSAGDRIDWQGVNAGTTSSASLNEISVQCQ